MGLLFATTAGTSHFHPLVRPPTSGPTPSGSRAPEPASTSRGGPDGIVGEAVRVLLQDEQYGHGARAVASEMTALRNADAMLPVLADLAAARHGHS